MENNINNTDSVFVQDDVIYSKKINPIAPENKSEDVGVSNVLYDNIVEVGTSSQFDLSSINSLTQEANTRNEMYNIYDTMCEDGQIGAVVKTYAQDTTQPNDDGNIIWATSSDAKINYLVNYYIDSLNINKDVYKWVYSLYKYGDVYIRLYRESEYDDALFINKSKKQLNEDIKIKAFKQNDKYAHYIEMVTNPAEMFELTKFGKTVGFIQSPVDGVLVKSQQNLDFMNYTYKFKREDIILYPPTEFVHASLDETVNRFDETVNIFLNTSDYDTDNNAYSYSVKKGTSILAGAYKTWRELQLLEASVLLNRVTKSSIVRLISVEVGDMPKENVTKTLQRIKQLIEQKAAINKGIGMTEYTNPGPIENNVYITTHDGVGAITTTQIGGDVDVKGLADLEWYRDKLFGALQVPKQYLNFTDDATGFNGGSSLTIISSRYAKTVKYVQTVIKQLVTNIINLILLDKGLDSYINNFEIRMQPPVTQEDVDKRDNKSAQVQLTSDIMNMLTDVEDQTARLKILKSLLSDIVTDDEVISELQQQIEVLDQQQEEVVQEQPIEDNIEEYTDEEEPLDINLSTDTKQITQEQPIEQETSEEEIILPSPEELGVNIADGEE